MLISLYLRKVKLTPEEGYVNVTGGKVWYQIIRSGTETPLLLLNWRHGFPGFYLNPVGDLGNERPIIFLDQLGCGRSDDNKDTTLMTEDTFVEQLNQFIDAPVSCQG